MQVADHATDDAHLLRVLLTGAGDLRLHDREQLGDDGRHSPEMAGAAPPAQDILHPLHLDPGPVSRDVDLLVPGHEQGTGTGRARPLRVRLQGTRVGAVVLGGSELQRVDVDRNDDDPALGTGVRDQGFVPGVQGAHGRYQADPLAGSTRRMTSV